MRVTGLGAMLSGGLAVGYGHLAIAVGSEDAVDALTGRPQADG